MLKQSDHISGENAGGFYRNVTGTIFGQDRTPKGCVQTFHTRCSTVASFRMNIVDPFSTSLCLFIAGNRRPKNVEAILLF